MFGKRGIEGEGKRRVRRKRASSSSIAPPRKLPVAKGSTEIVDAILEAGMELLSEGGLDALTTNHVAECAGVSVGSVYRYFSNKLSIVAEIDRRHRRVVADRFLAAVESSDDLEHVIRRVVEGFVVVSPRTVKLRAVLMREVPPGWVANSAEDIWKNVHERAGLALARHMPELPLAIALHRTFVALHAVEGVMMGHALWRSETGPMSIEVLIDELLRLVLGYLQAPSSGSGG